jgi:predicted RNA-binding Zn-ribbon protein involved in translation (DUF1610 family)
LDFEKRFSTEEACREYLFALRWPAGFQCPQCGGEKAWRMSRSVVVCRLSASSVGYGGDDL